MAPSQQHVTVHTAVEAAADLQSDGCVLLDRWRSLSPVERDIILTLVVRWAAHDQRAGLELLQPTTRSA